MFKQIFGAAFAAGLVAGLLVSVLQEFTTTRLIFHAEEYEHAAADSGILPAVFSHAPLRVNGLSRPETLLVHSDPKAKADGQWMPEDGLERFLYTVGSNITVGIAFALMLCAGFAVHGRAIDGRRGVIWGLAGFACFTLGPVLGLPPEVPGTFTADLVDRQVWWAGCALATAVGLGLMVFGRRLPFAVLGGIVLAIPHIIGAPEPYQLGGSTPPEIAGHFAAASIVVAAIFWASLGWLSGSFFTKLAPD